MICFPTANFYFYGCMYNAVAGDGGAIEKFSN